MRLPSWLFRGAEAWQREGPITDAQRRAILARYSGSPDASQQASSILTWLAVLVAGIGGIVLVAWNWTSIPAIVKVLLSAGPMLGLYVASAAASRTGHHVRAQRRWSLRCFQVASCLSLRTSFTWIPSGRACPCCGR